MEDKELRELIETVRMVRLSKALGLNDEQTVVLTRQYGKYREDLQKAQQERQQLLRDLKENVRSDAPDDQIQSALNKLVEHDRKTVEIRQSVLDEVGKDFTPKQKAKLYVFVSDFDQEMRKLVERAREGGAGPLMRFREMRENAQNRRGLMDEGKREGNVERPDPPRQGDDAENSRVERRAVVRNGKGSVADRA